MKICTKMLNSKVKSKYKSHNKVLAVVRQKAIAKTLNNMSAANRLQSLLEFFGLFIHNHHGHPQQIALLAVFRQELELLLPQEYIPLPQYGVPDNFPLNLIRIQLMGIICEFRHLAEAHPNIELYGEVIGVFNANNADNIFDEQNNQIFIQPVIEHGGVDELSDISSGSLSSPKPPSEASTGSASR